MGAFITQNDIERTVLATQPSTENTPPGSYIEPDKFSEMIKPKLQTARNYFYSNKVIHVHDASNYPKVYVTSDIHSDYRKLIQLLINANIITYPGINIVEQLYSPDIYLPQFLTNMIWKQSNVSLVILGDIIDGRRGQNLEIDDPHGSFEFLLHVFLFNLRIKALEKNSMVLFTFGNHDFHAVIKQRDIGFIDSYTSGTTKLFFDVNGTWMKTRKDVLLPFYEVLPLFFVMFGTGGHKEFAGIHAGFHDENGLLIAKDIQALQHRVNSLKPDESLDLLSDEDYACLASPISGDGGLWSRYYNKHESCASITELKTPLIVVGHCPTMFPPSKTYPSIQHESMNMKPLLYEGCDKGAGGRGCVTLSCENRLAHVDVSMSSSFFNYADKNQHRHRDAEMLLLEHKSDLSVSDRYYNVIRRISESGGNILMYSAPVLGENFPINNARYVKPRRVGGRRKTYRRKNGKRKTTRRRI